MQACPVMRAENAAGARIDKKDALRQLAVGVLTVEYMRAATGNPLAKIETPAWVDGKTPPTDRARLSRTPLIDVLADQLAGVGSESLWVDMVGALCKSPEGREWLRQRALAYAEWHADAAAYGDDE